MKRMLEVRRQHPVFGTGSFEVISVENPSVLAYMRRPASEEAPAPAASGRSRYRQATAGKLGTATPGPVKPSSAMPSRRSSPVTPGPAMSSPVMPAQSCSAPPNPVL